MKRILGVFVFLFVMCIGFTNVEAAQENGYEIYPTPHSIKYTNTESTLSKEVNIIHSDKVEEATLNKLKEILSAHTIKENQAIDKTKLTIILSVGEEKEEVKKFLTKNNLTLSTKGYNQYILAIKDNVVYINANKANDLFYGVATLKFIINQSTDKLKDLVINDYADVQYRGFIEGYYGIPWSHENRKSLMEFLGDFKGNTYIFAPKDDPYHSKNWRALYPQEDLEKIKELIEVGKKSNNKFVWTVHPFMSNQRFNFNNYDADLQVLLAKFNQLYDNGVRQFGILGDDVGSLDRNSLLKLLNSVSDWAKKKGDVEDILFCPAGYNHAWQGDYSELKILNKAPSNVQIFWTGNTVVSDVNQQMVDRFKNGSTTEGHPGRNPYIWSNWPVNDYNQARLLMGPGYIYKKGVTNLAGLVSNPMQQGQASKVALFSLADYAWNTGAFEADKTWNDSFKYVEPKASEALKTIAYQLQDISPNGHRLVLPESQNIKPIIDALNTAIENNNAETILAKANELKPELQKIIDAIDEFRQKSDNELLIGEMAPWLSSLRDKCQAGVHIIEGLNTTTKSEAWEAFAKASPLLVRSKDYRAPHIHNNIIRVEPGAKYLIPLMNKLNALLDKKVGIKVNETKEVKMTGFYASDILNTYDPNNGDMSKMLDGDRNTAITVYSNQGNYLPVDAYVGVKLSRPAVLDKIQIIQGRNGAEGDKFGRAVIEYSLDGKNYEELHSVNKAEDVDITVSGNKLAQYVRFRNLERVNVWTSIREFKVTTKDGSKLFTNVEELKEKQQNVQNNIYTLPEIEYTLEPGQFVGLDLGEISEIENIETNSSLSLEYSMNRINYSAVEKPYKNARYIILKNNTNAPVRFNNNTLKVVKKVYEGISLKNTNYTSHENVNAAFDKDLTTQAWFKNSQHQGKYAVYDLGRTIDLNHIRMVVSDGEHDFIRHGKISVSEDGQNYKDVLTIEATSEEDVATAFPTHKVPYRYKEAEFEPIKARYIKFELTKSKSGQDKWVRFNEIVLNHNGYIPTRNDAHIEMNAPETAQNNRSFIDDSNLVTAYKSDKAGKIIYYTDNKKLASFDLLTSGDEAMKLAVKLADGTIKDLGALDETYKHVDVSELGNVTEVIITFDGPSRSIHELILNYDIQEENYTPAGHANKEVLRVIIAKESSIDLTNKTKASADRFRKAIAEAKKAMENPDISQEEVDKIASELLKSIAYLKEKTAESNDVEANHKLLKAAIEIAESVNLDLYTKESADVLKEAVKAAKLGLKDDAISKEKTNQLIKAISDAVDKLVFKTTPAPKPKPNPNPTPKPDPEKPKATIEGYSRVTQNIRNDNEEIVGVLPINEKVKGKVVGDRVYIEYNGVKGKIWKVNIVNNPVETKGYTKFAMWIRDAKGNRLGIVPKGVLVKGAITKDARVLISHNGIKGYIFKANLSNKAIEITGYAKFTQNVRDKNGKIVAILKAGRKVSGIVENGKVLVNVNGVQGYVYEVNLGSQMTKYEGIAKFDQYIRNDKEEIVGILPKNAKVIGKVVGGRLYINYRGIVGKIWISNLD